MDLQSLKYVEQRTLKVTKQTVENFSNQFIVFRCLNQAKNILLFNVYHIVNGYLLLSVLKCRCLLTNGVHFRGEYSTSAT